MRTRWFEATIQGSDQRLLLSDWPECILYRHAECNSMRTGTHQRLKCSTQIPICTSHSSDHDLVARWGCTCGCETCCCLLQRVKPSGHCTYRAVHMPMDFEVLWLRWLNCHGGACWTWQSIIWWLTTHTRNFSVLDLSWLSHHWDVAFFSWTKWKLI